jgi:hypothetical protein
VKLSGGLAGASVSRASVMNSCHGRCSQTVANAAVEGGFSRALVEQGISRDGLFLGPGGPSWTPVDEARKGFRSRRSGVQIPPGAPHLSRLPARRPLRRNLSCRRTVTAVADLLGGRSISCKRPGRWHGSGTTPTEDSPLEVASQGDVRFVVLAEAMLNGFTAEEITELAWQGFPRDRARRKAAKVVSLEAHRSEEELPARDKGELLPMWGDAVG